MNHFLSTTIHAYSRLLSLFPASYKNKFREDMILDFSDMAEEAGGKGTFPLLIFLARELRDFPINLVRAQFEEITMSKSNINVGSLIGGLIFIALGLLALAGQLFRGFNFWGTTWPFFIIAIGALFFVGMFAGGKSEAGLAIPGSLLTAIGLMLFLQNLFDYWESWAYSWTVILMSVGLGIFIMGRYTENPGQRASGLRLLKLGAILFVVFGAFFEMLIFNSFGFSKFLLPVALILLGIYLILGRSGLLAKPQDMPAVTTDSPAKSEEK